MPYRNLLIAISSSQSPHRNLMELKRSKQISKKILPLEENINWMDLDSVITENDTTEIFFRDLEKIYDGFKLLMYADWPHSYYSTKKCFKILQRQASKPGRPLGIVLINSKLDTLYMFFLNLVKVPDISSKKSKYIYDKTSSCKHPTYELWLKSTKESRFIFKIMLCTGSFSSSSSANAAYLFEIENILATPMVKNEPTFIPKYNHSIQKNSKFEIMSSTASRKYM